MSKVSIFDEIKAIGIIDWLWFVVYLNRNEFHRNLDIDQHKGTMYELIKARDRAHCIDLKLDALKWE